MISSDGRYVAFESWASNLVVDDYNGTTDIFLYDRQTDQMTLVSQVDAGGAGNMSWRPSISNDGRYVGFKSAATNLVPGDTNWQDDIFVFDRVSGTIGRASVNGAGQEANSVSDAPAVSGDGSKVAFTSYADNLVANDTYGFADVFITDRPSGSIPRPPRRLLHQP
ncbi:MAG: PD40 domain-containing protein [Candidatus Promineofilum sp.]|nr:PD40 domain-containing protein [Promineifilum sp.]